MHLEPAIDKVHLSGYQRRDYEVVDYQLAKLPGTELYFRGAGSARFEGGEYFTCVGAAQTLGCFCQQPYPALLSARLGMPAINLGYGGAGPEFFVRQRQLHEVINRGKFAVIQVMSGRSQSNSLFECGGLEFLTRRADGRQLGSNEAYGALLAGNPLLHKGGPLGCKLAKLLARPKMSALVAETRRAWIESYRTLLQEITCPTVLLWFSTRSPDYHEDPCTLRCLFGDFPQLVNRTMVAEVAQMCSGYVECTTARGNPQPLFSRFTGAPVSVDPTADRRDLGVGRPWTHNRYYPSPEMHEDAAEVLAPGLTSLMRTPRT
jgi:hypothetical protein